MPNILDEIIEYKYTEVERRKSHTPIDELESLAARMPRCRNFYEAVTKSNPRGLNVIAEVKKASPSAGLIRKNFDPVKIAKTYQACGADAISCLTDEKYFQGSLDYISMIKEEVDLPILRKDFIVDEYQIFESKAAGADAILLIAEALDPSLLMDLMMLARELSLTSVVEVHDIKLLKKLRSLGSVPQKNHSLLGINNRDLSTMTVDFDTTSRLAEFVDNRSELISESGIKTREDVEKLKEVGVGAVLIGETLCRSKSIEKEFKELFAV
jgi:indole-3-glycerol phosphate synthase